MKSMCPMLTLTCISLALASCGIRLPAQNVKSVGSALPAGIIYQTLQTFREPDLNMHAYWRVEADGTPTQFPNGLPLEFHTLMIPISQLDFSEDGRRIVFQKSEGEDNRQIWLLDTQTGKQKQLTHDPDRANGFPHWWSGNPNIVFFMSEPKKQAFDMFVFGNLGIVNTDGSGYKIYEDIPSTLTSPSPDGKTFLYSDFKSLRIVSLDGQARTISPTLYPNFNLVASPNCKTNNSFFSVGNWSPDGTFVALIPCQGEITFMNLQDSAKTFSLTHNLPGMLTFSSIYAVWSSDSQYFALIGSTVQTPGPEASQSHSIIRIFDRTGKLQRQIDHPTEWINSLHWRPSTHEFLYVTEVKDSRDVIPATTVATPLPPPLTKAILVNLDKGATVETKLPKPIRVHAWLPIP